MGNHCNCGHCDCEEEKDDKSPEEKVEDLKKAIAILGFKVEETGDGEIKITQ